MSDKPSIDSIFCAAIDIESPDERRAFIEQACGEHVDLTLQVERLLHAHFHGRSILDAPVRPVATVDEPLRETAGSVIGPYKLLEKVGEGGMGTVWMAEQKEPIQRRVAVKVIKAGMDSKQVLARFEAERQALALMDHPSIARVLDAGTTNGEPGGVRPGRPYFVMELVKGTPITTYCDDKHLSVRQRLELFGDVCRAVQHAHQKGIIHRDLKPSNILIAPFDGKPVVKVIDFGVAKATGQRLTDETLFTGFGAVVGTPEYMSPEQAETNNQDIDTRSDIYSLGVLLYELLTGSTPLTRKRVREAALLDILRVIREEEPPRPSTRLSSTEELPSISAQRHTEPAKLTRLVRGELDWIVMKALEKDRNRRYETANGFAMDVQRYLADESVLACPPSAGYRLRKFARRNKGGLAVAALVLFFLVLIGGGVGWAVRDRAARQGRIGAEVDLILGDVERLEKEQKWPEALAAAQRAGSLTAGGADAATQERVRRVLHDLQMVVRLEELRLSEKYVAGERNERGDAIVTTGHPRLYAAAFRDFGVDVATLPAEESAARLRARPGVAIALAAALDNWASERRRRDPDQSKRLWALAAAVDPDPWRVSVRSASAALDVGVLLRLANAADTARQPPQSQMLLASSLRLCGQPEQALALLERGCEVHPDDFWIHFSLGALNTNVRPARLEAAVRHGIAARALRPRSAATWCNLGNALRAQKKLDEAIACYKKAIDLDPKHAYAHSNFSNALRDQKKLPEAIAVSRKAIELDPNNALLHIILGNAHYDQKKLDEAIACYKKAIDLDPKSFGAHNNLGNALRDQKKLPESIACYRKAIDLDPKSVQPYNNLGLALAEQKKLDEAIACYRQAIELGPKSAPPYINLGNALRAQSKLDEAIVAFRKGIDLDPKLAAAHNNLGNALHAQQKWPEAVAAYRKAIELDPKFANAYGNLGVALSEQKKLDEAIVCHTKAIELDPNEAGLHHNLGLTFYAQQKWPEAVAAYRKAIELDPNQAAAYISLGNILRDPLRKFDEAIACGQKAIELDPKNSLAHINLGCALRDQRKLPEAIAAFRQAIALDPNNTYAHRNLGNALRAQRKLDDAIAAFRKVIELDPKSSSAHISLGALLCDDLKEYGKAIESFRKAIELDPNNAIAYRNLGIALSGQRNLPEAVAAYRRAIELDPNNPYAHRNLGNALRAQQKLPDAIAAYRKAIELDPNSQFAAGAYFSLGKALEDQGKLDETIACFRKAAELAPNFALAHCCLAWLLTTCREVKLRDAPGGLEAARKAVAAAPQSPLAWQVLGWAHYRAGAWKASIEALEKSCALDDDPKGGGAFQWFFLAMAHRRLAEIDKARDWYDRAVQWADKNKPKDELLRRSRTEAAELLELKEKK
jgi:tetratricopeptide (TPR) repeat protein